MAGRLAFRKNLAAWFSLSIGEILLKRIEHSLLQLHPGAFLRSGNVLIAGIPFQARACDPSRVDAEAEREDFVRISQLLKEMDEACSKCSASLREISAFST